MALKTVRQRGGGDSGQRTWHADALESWKKGMAQGTGYWLGGTGDKTREGLAKAGALEAR